MLCFWIPRLAVSTRATSRWGVPPPRRGTVTSTDKSVALSSGWKQQELGSSKTEVWWTVELLSKKVGVAVDILGSCSWALFKKGKMFHSACPAGTSIWQANLFFGCSERKPLVPPQGGGGSFKNRKPIGEIGCCESGMAERSHWWTERCLRSPLFLSLSLNSYLCIYVSMYLCIYLFIYLCIYVSTYLCIYVSIYLSISPSIDLLLL